MASKALPCPTVLRQLLRYEPETGKLFWRERPVEMFQCLRIANSWNTRCAGKEAFVSDSGKGYRQGYIFGGKYHAHRVIWALVTGSWPDDQIDHINGLRGDNRIANLRSVTGDENQRNKRCPNTNRSGAIGVHWNKACGKWAAQIQVAGRPRHLGYFDDFEAAVEIRKAAEVDLRYHKNHGRSGIKESAAALHGEGN